MRTRSARRHLSAACALLLFPALLFGCAGKTRVALYLPAGETLAVKTVRAEPTPEGLIAALQAHGALPDAPAGYLYCAVAEEPGKSGGTRPVVRLDVSDALGAALAAAPDTGACVQALADTFLTFYGAELFVLTVEGVNLQTLEENYTDGIHFDEYVRAE